jgi:hypothetical protein
MSFCETIEDVEGAVHDELHGIISNWVDNEFDRLNSNGLNELVTRLEVLLAKA